MNFIETELEGCFIIEPKLIYDGRGYFMESFNERIFREKTGTDTHFVQDNQSFSSKGVLRGLHYQTGDHVQAKLVRVLQGEVLDVAVDLRPGSPTFGKHADVILSAENQRQFFVPRGFAHGFLVLSETATFFYKCDNFYNKESEGGIMYNDPDINIDWQFNPANLIISEKDQFLDNLANARKIW
ncbi:dTDP-4-dehydrorhamnose 3,5-epimerase [Flavobacterium pallidum]|uniref:dTDP-4-dehydrorhamnose 3,5-epimerase n=1 Tax=Flavobacterium pallidum TaxID=2172098 RepID=A0A2S1SFE0_9FLAO|nr:dTDP-4-dehydrorhamnose 3,5-epimerase [Flavobacterium pallidum]AWI25081.1 dTDP-4-dehydrorhamnose 3,5-epimerase [Flavobacterium pallidum]